MLSKHTAFVKDGYTNVGCLYNVHVHLPSIATDNAFILQQKQTAEHVLLAVSVLAITDYM